MEGDGGDEWDRCIRGSETLVKNASVHPPELTFPEMACKIVRLWNKFLYNKHQYLVRWGCFHNGDRLC